MTSFDDPRTSIDLLQGTLSALVLKSLSFGPRHGYAIARWLEQTSAESLPIEEGSLYPTLHRLEARGLIEGQWRLSATSRRVKVYGLTKRGREQLQAERARWKRFAAAVTRVLGARKATP